MSRLAVFCVLAAVLVAGASAGAPARKLLAGGSNVAVSAPGAQVLASQGVVAAAAPGTKVLATKDAVAVKAPANTKVAVDKKTGDVAVSAPGTQVVSNKATGVTAVKAPGTQVVSTPTGTAVAAPFTTVLTGDAAAGSGCRTVVRVPIIGLNFCGDRKRFFL